MKKLLATKSGYSLLELIAGIPLVALIFLPLGFSLTFMVRTFQEVYHFTNLQNEMMIVLDDIRVGYIPEQVTPDVLIGLSTAEKVSIKASKTGITIYPVNDKPTRLDASFFLMNNEIRSSGAQGSSKIWNHEVLFPPPDKIDRTKLYRIKTFTFENTYPLQHVEPKMITVTFEAEVRYRKQSDEESVDDDKVYNLKTVEYQMLVFLGTSVVN